MIQLNRFILLDAGGPSYEYLSCGQSPFTLRHLSELKSLGVKVVPPVSKVLACGDVGEGAMASPEAIDAAAWGACHVPAAGRAKQLAPCDGT